MKTGGNVPDGINNWGHEDAHLDEEGNGILDVAKADVQGGQRQPDAAGREKCRQNKNRQKQSVIGKVPVILDHHAEQQPETEAEIDQQRRHRSYRNEDSRKINLRNQLLIGDQAAAGHRHSIRKEGPRRQTGEGKKRVGWSIALDPRQSIKDQRKDRHRD